MGRSLYQSIEMKNVLSNAYSYLSKARLSTWFIPSVDQVTKLGRWTIDYNHQVIQRKVDQANEDHCGCCVNEFNNKPDDKYAFYYL